MDALLGQLVSLVVLVLVIVGIGRIVLGMAGAAVFGRSADQRSGGGGVAGALAVVKLVIELSVSIVGALFQLLGWAGRNVVGPGMQATGRAGSRFAARAASSKLRSRQRVRPRQPPDDDSPPHRWLDPLD